MKKALFFSFLAFLAFVLPATGFAVTLTDEESEALIIQERRSRKTEGALKTIPFTEDFFHDMMRSLAPRNNSIMPQSIWMSKDPNDLKPLVGTKWYFQYKIISNFDATIEFDDEVTYTNDGTVGLFCTNEYGSIGGAFYSDLPYGGRGFGVLIPGTIIDKTYYFSINGNSAFGKYRHYSHSSGTYSDFYALTGVKISGPTPEPDPASSYNYYVPYFRSDASHSTGIGLSNLNESKTASAKISIYNSNGTLIGSSSKKITARGQDAFTLGGSSSGEGWVFVESDQPLGGLCFLANISKQNYMADIPISSEAHTNQIVPHVAQNKTWDTIIFVCNPNSSASEVTLKFVDSAGNLKHSCVYTISRMGSGQFNLSDLVSGNTYSNGRVEIVANQPVAAFALYNDLKSGGMNYAGICAISSTDGE